MSRSGSGGGKTRGNAEGALPPVGVRIASAATFTELRSVSL